ncbi:MAG TPA: hypothetical protein VF028_08520 [Actinomycetota bacterium]|nr:hypothetical protein [Actinomycetota bacterium]
MKWLVVLLVAVLVLAVLWWVRSRSARRDRARSIGPIERQRIEEEIRRRHGGPGPTVDGGQHLR